MGLPDGLMDQCCPQPDPAPPCQVVQRIASHSIHIVNCQCHLLLQIVELNLLLSVTKLYSRFAMQRRTKRSPDSAAARPFNIGKKQWSSHDAQSLRAEELPPGPRTLRELYAYPTQHVESIGIEGVQRIHKLLSKGAVIYSDYSGIDTYREAFELGYKACEAFMYRHERQQAEAQSKSAGSSDNKQIGVDTPFKLARSCDNGSVPRGVLLSLAKCVDKGSCVFTDIRARLVPVAVKWLEEAMPPRSASEEEAATAFDMITTWMMSNRTWIFSPRSKCLLHKKLCPAHPPFRLEGNERLKQLYAGINDGPLYFHTSGMTCKGWSTVGHQLHWADPIGSSTGDLCC